MKVIIDIDENLYQRILYHSEEAYDAFSLPVVVENATPLPEGHWIYKPFEDISVCSNCGCCKDDYIIDPEGIQKNTVIKFCPNCGAKMIEPQESEVQA